jgi:VanZ family protein
MAALSESMSALLRLAAWLSALGLVVASWTPADYMIRTFARGSFEHVGAYFITTLLFLFAYRRWSPFTTGLALGIYAGILEVGQLYVPGRHSQIEDFAASCIGVTLAILPALWIRRASSSPNTR